MSRRRSRLTYSKVHGRCLFSPEFGLVLVVPMGVNCILLQKRCGVSSSGFLLLAKIVSFELSIAAFCLAISSCSLLLHSLQALEAHVSSWFNYSSRPFCSVAFDELVLFPRARLFTLLIFSPLNQVYG